MDLVQRISQCGYTHVIIINVALVFLSSAVVQGRVIQMMSSYSVSSLCSTTLCPETTICRVINICDRYMCQPKSTCIPNTLPTSIDKTCRYYSNLKYAVLEGPLSNPRLLRSVECGIDNRCPAGSVCIMGKQHSYGTCCYDNVLTPTEQNEIYVNDAGHGSVHCLEARVCSDNSCPPGYACRNITVRCKRPPCPIHSHCVQLTDEMDKGTCPKLPPSVPDYCKHQLPERQCYADSECPTGFKCCETTCAGRKCLKTVKNS